MRITVELPDDVFATSKSAAQVTREVRQAAAMFWLARGELAPEHATAMLHANADASPSLIELLLAMPSVGDDEDFTRQPDVGRPDEPLRS